MSRTDWYLAAFYGCGVLALWIAAKIIRYDDEDDR